MYSIKSDLILTYYNIMNIETLFLPIMYEFNQRELVLINLPNLEPKEDNFSISVIKQNYTLYKATARKNQIYSKPW